MIEPGEVAAQDSVGVQCGELPDTFPGRVAQDRICLACAELSFTLILQLLQDCVEEMVLHARRLGQPKNLPPVLNLIS